MKSNRIRVALIALAAFILLNASPALAKDKWIQLTTKNLNVVSNADENETREIALKIEQFHFIFTKLFGINTDSFLPVTVIVFKNDGAFKPFKPLYNGKPSNVAGYFQPSPDENLIALTARSASWPGTIAPFVPSSLENHALPTVYSRRASRRLRRFCAGYRGSPPTVLPVMSQ